MFCDDTITDTQSYLEKAAEMNTWNACELVFVATANDFVTNVLSLIIVVRFEPDAPDSLELDHWT